jgi:1-acyl-sn-glycerol-3-phosphate acyltransferase
MELIKNILARILALWAMVSFIATFLIVFIPSLLCWLVPDPKGQDLFIRLSRVWMTVWLHMVGCTIRIRGKKNFKKGKAYIVTCNHNSLMDVPLSCPFIPGPNKTIAKSSFTKVPLFGLYYMKGAVLVDRKSEASRKNSFDKMKAVLRKGMHMCVYPEGTRNRTAEPLKSFHSGAFRLATETGTPIIPAVIFNTKKVLPLHKTFYFWPHRIEMHFLEEIPVANQSADEMKSRVFEVMKAYYEKYERT